MAPHLMWVNLIIVSPHTMNHRGKNMRIFRYLRLGIGRFGLGIGAVIGIILALVVVLNWLFGIPVAQAVSCGRLGVYSSRRLSRFLGPWLAHMNGIVAVTLLSSWTTGTRAPGIIWQYLRGNSQIFLLSQTL